MRNVRFATLLTFCWGHRLAIELGPNPISPAH